MKMKVMFVCHDTLQGGGAALSLCELMEELRKHGTEIIVVLRGENKAAVDLDKLGISYYVLNYQWNCSPENTVMMSPEELWRNDYEAGEAIADIAVQNNVDIICTNCSVVNAGAIGALLAHKPHIWYIREFVKEDIGHEYIYEDYQRRLLQNTDALVAISHAVWNMLKSRFGLSAHMMYDGLNLKKYGQNHSGGDAKPAYNGMIRVLLAGVISSHKGQLDAVRAFELLLDRRINNIHMDIIGNNDNIYAWYLQNYIIKHHLENYIHVYSYKENLFEARKDYDISLTCSRMEALGRVTLEAMLAGNLVIGSRSGGTTEIIGAGEERGLLYEPGNIKELAEKLEMVVNNLEKYRTKYIENAKIFVKEYFDVKQYALRTLTLYEETVKKYQYDRHGSFVEELNALYVGIRENMEPGSISNVDNVAILTKRCSMYTRMFQCTHKWLQLRHRGIYLDKFFLERGLKTVAIYGLGPLGRDLCDELGGSRVAVRYLIDRKYESLREYMGDMAEDIKKPGDDLEGADAVVISVFLDVERIRELYIGKTISVFSLEEIINSLTEER